MTPLSWTPEPASGITQRFEANGQTFELAECGSGIGWP
jgi:hypothetical protein